MSAPSLVAMLPLKISGAHYDDNIERLRLLIDSLDAFLRLPFRLQVHAVCVPSEITRARAAFGPGTRSHFTRTDLRFISEESLVPGIGAHKAIGWFKQQALKLAFVAASPTAFCLTLDPDVVLCRDLFEDDLLYAGRCTTSWMAKSDHPAWWDASVRVLGMATDAEAPGLNVTPQMLARPIAAALAGHLRQRLGGGNPWRGLLAVEAAWTEYTLYSVFAEASGLLDRYHRPGVPGGRRLLGRSVWVPANIENYSLAAIHDDPDGGLFSVCASHTHVPVADLRAMFAELLRHAGKQPEMA